MSDEKDTRRVAQNWSCCLVAVLGTIALVFVVLVALPWFFQRQSKQHGINAWETQVEALKAGKSTSVYWPEPLCLEEFVREQPDVAAKITHVDFLTGKVADPRFGYVKQFSNLKDIYFDEVWEGTDAFLQRISGMKSVRTLSFYRSPVSEEGVRAVASFPNLSKLDFDHYWDIANRGHKGITTLSLLEVVEITDELIDFMASLPNLRTLEIESRLTKADSEELQKKLPNVKIDDGT
jgi:hypothetical protein